MKRVIALALVIVVIAGVGSFAQAADKPNVTGQWKWTISYGGRTREATLDLKLEGNKLSGSIVRREGQETPIQDANYKQRPACGLGLDFPHVEG